MLIALTMGQNCEKFISMNLESIKDADKIIYCDGGSIDKTLLYIDAFTAQYNKKVIEINNEWISEDKSMNGKQRNFYLNYLKENYPNDWVICLDADEILDDGGIEKIKQFIKEREPGLYNVKMRHFIGDIGHEDATRPVHVVPCRLFKISEAIKYPPHSHPVLEGELMGACLDTTIWHLGHLPVSYMDYILKRYKQHVNDSIYHPKAYLDNWKINHLFGVYPQRQINPVELPKQICDRYEIDKDYFYFMERNLEIKHFIDAIHWKEFFKCKDAIEYGCGKGPRIYAMRNVGIDSFGIELSNYAVNNRLDKENIVQGNVLDYQVHVGPANLVIAYDLLEHINYIDLDKAIDNLIEHTKKHILISVPTLGDPNLVADPTHIIKEHKKWWIKQFTDKGLKLIPTPEHFLYKEQIMIFEK